MYLYEVIRVKILNHCFIFSLSNKSAESVVWWWNGYALRKYYRKNQSAELADIGFFCSNQHHHHFSLVYCYDELKSGIIALVSTKAHSVWKSLKLSHLLNFMIEASNILKTVFELSRQNSAFSTIIIFVWKKFIKIVSVETKKCF